MPDVPSHAKCVIIGAGIVGNCLAGHLAKLGWRELVLLDKGPLPNPGGSTGHASNFIFPTDHNKEMAFLTVESQKQYIAYGVNNAIGTGGVTVNGATAVLDMGANQSDSVGTVILDGRAAEEPEMERRLGVHRRFTAATRRVHAPRSTCVRIGSHRSLCGAHARPRH